MYCAMNLTHCGNTTGGWTRVARIDMTSVEGTCPSPLETIPSPRGHAHILGLDVLPLTTPHWVSLSPRSVAKLLGITTTRQMLFMARMALTPLTLMACPSLMTHLVATCGRMLQVTLSPVSYMKQIALVLETTGHCHHPLYKTIIIVKLGM